MKALSPTAVKLLADNTFDIEYSGFLSNHAKHAIIALDRLNAPASRVEEYWNAYTSMTPYNIQLHKVDQAWDAVRPVTIQDWKQLRGKKQRWQEMVAFLNHELAQRFDGNTDLLLSEYAPDLLTSPSLAGALTHGIIHLGWAVDAGSPWMIAEGLAYLNFAAIGVDPALLQWDCHNESTPMESLIRVAKTWEEENLETVWVDRAKQTYSTDDFHPELAPAGFQREVAKVLKAAHPLATELPTWLTEMTIPELFQSLYQMTTLLYLAARDGDGNGNFIILHLITSLWGLEHTLSVVDKSDPGNRFSLTRKAIAQWYATLIGLVATTSGGFPSASSLEMIQNGGETVDVAVDCTDPVDLDWGPIVQRGIAEVEEHNIKLVYVTRELWLRYGRWHGYSEAAKTFVLTPEIGPESPQYDA